MFCEFNKYSDLKSGGKVSSPVDNGDGTFTVTRDIYDEDGVKTTRNLVFTIADIDAYIALCDAASASAASLKTDIEAL